MSSPPLHHKESPLFAADRSAYWHQLRSLGPVVEIAAGDPILRGYYLTRRDDVRAALLDPHTFASPPKTFAVSLFGAPLPQVPLSCRTPSEHARFGSVLHPLFSPKGLAPFDPVLRERACALVDAAAARGHGDATEIADTYAAQALLAVCGLPADDGRAIRLTRAAVVGDSTGAAQLALVKWLNSSLDAGLGNPRRAPGILWPLLERLVQDNDFPLSKIEVISVILLLFSVAGIEMVSAAIGFALLYLARDRQLQIQLREDTTQIPAFVEEILRLETPGPAIPRMTTREVDVGGFTIPAHSAVWLALEAAGRENGGDEISRTRNGAIQRQRHWAFGGGMHRCLGLHLARREMTTFVTEWLTRVPQFGLEPGCAPSIVHKPTGVTHLDSLMLSWENRMPP
ncbi:cytochrome P450 [Mycobacterium sp.]|uniref:cytochrome P450 n=1 Tax=Mycobacterium sp. TaxID=1785 RepID=UPI00128241A7|nr:cytochrome P450 [Mycobacterium sp.]KAA8964273.1 MAG: cytochrome P450 [Mycobacterium sp.]